MTQTVICVRHAVVDVDLTMVDTSVSIGPEAVVVRRVGIMALFGAVCLSWSYERMRYGEPGNPLRSDFLVVMNLKS